MCIYCGTMKYRKIYENHFGKIPYDEYGRTYEIHHIDNNHKNNNPMNLKCVTIQEHYDIHLEQKDWYACYTIALRLQLLSDELSKLASNREDEKVNNGTH